MTTVVTGASGHVGGNLVRELIARNRPVRALVHKDRSALEGLDIECVTGDITDKASVRAALEGAEVVFHLAAHISILDRDPRVVPVNVDGVRNVAEAALDAGVKRLVHVSSIHAYNMMPATGAIDEDRPRSQQPECPPYDASKAAGEAALREVVAKGLDATIVNPTGIIGPNDFRPSRMGEVLLKLATGELPGLVDGGFDWVDVRDVCAGVLLAEEKGQTGRNYILSGNYCRMPELAARAAAITGTRAPRFTSPMWLARFGAPFVTGWSKMTGQRPLYTSAALHALRGPREMKHARAKTELGYSPRPLDETLRDTYSWFRSQGTLES